MKQSLVQIAVSCQRAARLVNQLLALALAEDPGQAMRRVSSVDFEEVARSEAEEAAVH
jgi:signal transduction histidine kinase